jgi:PAS domain S-box-containing protein
VAPERPRPDDETVIQNLREAVFVVDTAHTVVYANARLAETLAVSRDELVGQPLAEMDEFVAEGLGALRKAIERVLQEESPEERVELETVHPDLAPVQTRPAVEARISQFTAENGPNGALVVLRDISRRKDMEAQLREREERLTAMFEDHSAPMLLIEPSSGDIIDANRAAVEFYGYDEDVLTELQIDDINCYSREEVARERERAKTEKRNHFVFDHELASGEIRTVEVHSSPIQVGERDLLFSIIHDITQQKEYEHELRLFRKAVEHAGHAVIITDVNGIIEYVNPQFESQTGYDSEEALGKTPQILKSGKQDESFYEDLWGTILAGDVWEADLVNQRRSGELYYTQQTIAPITNDGTITNFVAIQSDITNRKLSKKWLSELNRVLRHNVRNSLTAIIGHAEVLVDEVDDDQRSHVERILDQANSLAETSEKSSLIRQHLSSEESGTTTIELTTVVERLVSEFETEYPDATIRTDLEPAVVETGAATFRAVLSELVDNAVRHNDRESPTVTIAIENPDPSSAHAKLRVIDDGPGIDDQERSAVEPGIDRQLTHSSGLGLAHVHWIVTDCGGELTITDNEPRGTVVTLSLPRAE